MCCALKALKEMNSPICFIALKYYYYIFVIAACSLTHVLAAVQFLPLEVVGIPYVSICRTTIVIAQVITNPFAYPSSSSEEAGAFRPEL